jgi:hypothetical protein
MLKITRIDTPTEQRLILEGRLVQPWTADLSSHWEQARRARPERRFIVDLRGITRIDETGERNLALMKSERAEFLARGIRIKHLLKALQSKAGEQTDPRRSPAGNPQPQSEPSEVEYDAKRSDLSDAHGHR